MTGIWQATLRDLIEVRGEADVKAELSDFSCPLNPDVEYFIRQKAIEFARQGIASKRTIMQLSHTTAKGRNANERT